MQNKLICFENLGTHAPQGALIRKMVVKPQKPYNIVSVVKLGSFAYTNPPAAVSIRAVPINLRGATLSAKGPPTK